MDRPLYVEPEHHFTYLGFGWLRPWPGWGMHAHFMALGMLSLGIAAGYRPRLCAALFCIGFTYVELLDRTTYLNHYYLMSLVSLLLAVLPSSRDAAPRWTIWVLRAQVGIVYLCSPAWPSSTRIGCSTRCPSGSGFTSTVIFRWSVRCCRKRGWRTQ